jgi:type I restriction enzyme S subunit
MSNSRFKPYPAYKDSGVEWLGQVPAAWRLQPLWTMYRRAKRTGHAEQELLSVYRDYGVIPTASRDDNFNRPSEDLSTYQLVKERDLVTNKMKTWQGSIAISAHTGIVSPAYHVYVPMHDESDRYIHHLLRSSPYVSGYMQMSKGIRVGQWDLEPEAFSRILVLLQ